MPGATAFPGGEGIWCHDGTVWFTTKIDHSVHAIDLQAQRHTLVWRGDPDGLGIDQAVLSGVDNVTVDAGSGDLYVAEDGANMEVVMITPDGVVAPFLRLAGPGHEESEITGPCFDPSRSRLYFSSERGATPRGAREIIPAMTRDIPGAGAGVTYEVTGPFRGKAKPPAEVSPVTTIANAGDGGSSAAVPVGVGGVIGVAAIGGAAMALRRRGGRTEGS